jgi:hypothetical protein
MMFRGKLNKAPRGELVGGVPISYVKSPTREVAFDPDEQAQDIIRLIFDEFDRGVTVHGVLRCLIADGIRLPVRSQSRSNRGQLDWRMPCRETLRHILRHPMYTGAYRYGFRPTEAHRQRPGHPRSGRGGGLPAEDCLVLLKNRFPSYISWERFEANQVAGSCGRCGKRMYVRYGRANILHRVLALIFDRTTGCRSASRSRRPRSSSVGGR